MALTDYVLMPGADYQALCDAIRAKTGKSEALTSGELASEIAGITGGGGGAEITEFLASTTATNEYLSTFGAFCMAIPIDEATYNAWNANTKPVKVIYDGVEHTCTPQEVMGGTAVGNLTGFGGTSNGEEFAITVLRDNGYFLICGSTVDTAATEHTVRIYQEASATMDGVYTVTFMTEDGSALLYERYVADGDDCADVVARGLLDTPTKDSTVQYNYTYSGWSLTNGGAADASALSAVTADRVVYAAFASAVRYYTVTYYDGDTVLKTESLAYGSTPSYMPAKDGASFVEWTPSLATVTGDASYTAVWQEKVTFAGGSWADIAAISESGQAAEYFAVGDKKTITAGDTTLELTIIGFNHDDLADGSGKAGMTIISKNVLPDTMPVSDWTALANTMKTVLKPQLPSDLQSAIKPVIKQCDVGTLNAVVTPVEVAFDLFPLSFDECNIQIHTSLTRTDSDWEKKITTLGTPYKLFIDTYMEKYGGPSYASPLPAMTGCWYRQWLRGAGPYGLYVDVNVFGSTKYYASTQTHSSQRTVMLAFCI